MITILRLGHRYKRDERISTHCGLVARAFGASSIIYSGEHDQHLIDSINRVSENWGSGFSVSYEKNWRKVIQDFKGTKVHLTMYGMPFEKQLSKFNTKRNILIIIGSEKVPGEVYQMADYNIAVYNQPHSEVAALAIILDRLNKKPKLKSAKKKIVPQERGKKVIEK